jgi:hypothetical protein
MGMITTRSATPTAPAGSALGKWRVDSFLDRFSLQHTVNKTPV